MEKASSDGEEMDRTLEGMEKFEVLLRTNRASSLNRVICTRFGPLLAMLESLESNQARGRLTSSVDKERSNLSPVAWGSSESTTISIPDTFNVRLDLPDSNGVEVA